jgi:CRP/FNR family transcriptional regulator, cyclic AMP receptor protein
MRKVLHLMGALNDQDVAWLTAHGETRFVPEETVVIRQGHPIEAVLILLEGKLSVRLAGDREVATLYPGEVLGEISFVDARPPSASVVAVQPSHLFAVSAAVLTNKLERDDGFAGRFYRALAIFLADRLRTTTANLGYGKEVEVDADQIDESEFDGISLAATRFDEMLRQLRINT